MKTLTIITIVLGEEVDEWVKDRIDSLFTKEEKVNLMGMGEITLKRTPMSQTTYKLEEHKGL